MSPPDISVSVSFPSAGVIRLRSDSLFGDAESPACRRFIERVFQSEAIASVTIMGGDAPRADLRYCSRTFALPRCRPAVESVLDRAGPATSGAAVRGEVTRVAPSKAGPRRPGTVRYYRHDSVVTGWEIKSDLPGRLRLKNPVLYRKNELCQAIERELMGVLGIDQYKTNSITCTVLVALRPAGS